jgi:predicted PurR-regulated permease PerM
VKTLGAIVGVVILLAALKAASSIVVPLLIAITIAAAFQPISDRLARWGMPPIVASLVTVACVLAVLAGAGAVVIVAVRDLAVDAPKYVEDFTVLRERAMAWLEQRGMESMATSVQEVDVGAHASSFATDAALAASGIVGDFINVLLLTVFIQLEAQLLKEKLALILAKRSVERTSSAIEDVQKYLRVKSLLALANGVLLGLWCWGWGVSNPVLWGVAAFALNFVPIIGSLMAAIPPILLAIIELGWGSALGVAAGYVAVNIVVDNMIEPRLMGRALGLSPLVLMISLLVWGFVLGPVGALLSFPLTVAVRIYLDHHPETRHIGLLLAGSTKGYGDLKTRRAE